MDSTIISLLKKIPSFVFHLDPLPWVVGWLAQSRHRCRHSSLGEIENNPQPVRHTIKASQRQRKRSVPPNVLCSRRRPSRNRRIIKSKNISICCYFSCFVLLLLSSIHSTVLPTRYSGYRNIGKYLLKRLDSDLDWLKRICPSGIYYIVNVNMLTKVHTYKIMD